MSSISGSDSEDEEEDESDREGSGTSGNAAASEDNGVAGGRISSKVVFQNSTGQYVSVYRCILQGKVRLVEVAPCLHVQPSRWSINSLKILTAGINKLRFSHSLIR